MGTEERQLMESMQARLRTLTEEGDPSSILDPTAVSEARRLRELVTAEPTPVGAFAVLGWFRWQRFQLLDGDQRDEELQEAVQLFQVVYSVDPSLVPEPVRNAFSKAAARENTTTQIADSHSAQLIRRANELILHNSTDNLDSLNRAVDLLQQAVDRSNPEHPNYSGLRSTLYAALLARYSQTQSVGDLDRAVNLYTEVVNVTTAEEPNYALYLAGLEFVLRLRFFQTGQMEDLDKAIMAGEKAVGSSLPDDPNQVTWMYNLGEALYLRFERAGNKIDIDRAIEVYERAAGSDAKGCPSESECLFKLAQSLIMRFFHARAATDLDHAIEVSRRSIHSAPPSDPGRAGNFSQLGIALYLMFKRANRLNDLEESVQMSQAAMAAAREDDPERAVYLSRLGIALTARSQWSGRRTDADEAITALREALAVSHSQHTGYPGFLTNLAWALRARFDYTDSITDLDEAVVAAHQALDLTSAGDSELPARLSLLAGMLWHRSGRSGATSDIDDAIQALRDALNGAPLNHPARPGYLANLAVALAARFAITADMSHLDEAVETARVAVESTPRGGIDFASCLSNLGNLLQTRARWTGTLANLDEAAEIGRKAVALTPPNDPSRALHLSMLGNALHDLHVWTSAISYLDEAVEVGRQAVLATAPMHVRRAVYLANLGRNLHQRFSATGNPADLDKAIEVMNQAAKATPFDHPQQPMYLNNLGRGLLTRFERTGQIEDLNLAIETAQKAIEVMSSQQEAALMTNLAEALLIRFERTEERQDLDRAVEAAKSAVTAARPDQPEAGRSWLVLGRVLAQRFDITANITDLDEVISCWRSATYALGRSPDRVKAAAAWGQAAARARRTDEAFAGFREAVASVPLLIWRGLDRNVKERRLSDLTGLASAAAAWAIEAGQLDDAVELLEQGRSVLWDQALHIRTDLSRLKEVDADLARELEGIGEVLERPPSVEDAQVNGAGELNVDMMAETVLYRRAADRWDHLLTVVRQLPGFETFLTATPFCDLQPAASQGPVVIINLSGYRCDALIVTTSGAQLVPLPDLTYDKAVERCNAMLNILAQVRRNPGMMPVANGMLTSVLGWAWSVVVRPVLQAMEIPVSDGQAPQSIATDDLPRIWWCPTGPAAVFPLHAAASPSGICALDLVTSSYTPSLRALLRASTLVEKASSDKNPRILAVGMPSTPGMADLPNVTAELEVLAAHLPVDLQLLPPDATVVRVVQEMATHNWVHLSCHGNSEGAVLDNAPYHREAGSEDGKERPEYLGVIPAALHLADGALTLTRIGEINVQGELAYLSACDTSTSSGRLPDEAFHITASMQFAGYHHVIGSLWWVTDSLAPEVAQTVYARLTAEGYPNLRNVATAVHDAGQSIRSRHPNRPVLWANYVHFGP